MKRLLPFALTLALSLLLMVTAAGSGQRTPVTVVLNGEALSLDSAYIENGHTMASLRSIAEALGLTVTWNQASQTAYLSDGSWQPTFQDVTVALDPGHGGSSTGAQYNGIRESDLNLSIAREAADALRAHGIHVVLTRNGDEELSLYRRTALAAEAGADLFISIHCNASDTDPEASGIYTAYHPDVRGSWSLADTLQGALVAATRAADTGSWSRPNLAVLRTAKMPAALVECGYMSTPEELERLLQPDYQKQLSLGIAQGILSYLGGADGGF